MILNLNLNVMGVEAEALETHIFDESVQKRLKPVDSPGVHNFLRQTVPGRQDPLTERVSSLAGVDSWNMQSKVMSAETVTVHSLLKLKELLLIYIVKMFQDFEGLDQVSSFSSRLKCRKM